MTEIKIEQVHGQWVTRLTDPAEIELWKGDLLPLPFTERATVAHITKFYLDRGMVPVFV